MTINSSQLTKNDKHQLVFENDTVRLTYDFSGKNGLITVNVFNKTNQPLYVNWQKSALIRDNHAVGYFDRNVHFSGNGGSSSVRFGHFAGSSSHFIGSFALPEGMAFVPPSSDISRALVNMTTSGPMTLELPDSIPVHVISDLTGTETDKSRLKTYDETQSPIRFKSYLIFMMGLNNTQEFAQTCDFYIGEALDTKFAPEIFPNYQQQGDKFFIKYHKQQ